MKKKNKIIIVLLIIGTLLFGILRFIVIPDINKSREEYYNNQNDSLTHDIESVLKYKNKYMGNASNDGNLFYNLPLNDVPMKFAIDPENCILTVNYLQTVSDIGQEKVNRDLLYNSIASMALIDNLKGVTYNFSGDTFTFTREELQKEFGQNLSSLLNKEKWTEKVQNRLNDSDFVNEFYK